MMDLSNFPMTGKWIWNDGEKSLEFLSNNQTTTTSRQTKKQKEKVDSRSAKHIKPKMPNHQVIKISRDHLTVTLEDVKDIAKNRLLEVDYVSVAFENIFESTQLDEFLVLLLNYFHWFFEKRTYEQNPNPLHIEQSNSEKKYYAEMCARMGAAQKFVGRAYGVLILGLGNCDGHHMSCGEKLVSNSNKDRSMFETLYSFSAFFVWITFRRREFEVIKQEINRMLRTDTFNPMLRIKSSQTSEQADEDGEQKEQKPSIPESKHTEVKRPPILTVIHQRSNALVSILPSPKEGASWLFTRPALPEKCKYLAHQSDPPKLTKEEVLAQKEIMKLHMSHLKLGIIGEPLNQFNPVNLSPLDEEEEETDKLKIIQTKSDLIATPSGGHTSEPVHD